MFAIIKTVIILFTFSLFCNSIFAQGDSMRISTSGDILPLRPVKNLKDTTAAKYNPNKAIIRSAIIPGWGQIYNKKYWKLPLVYGALGTTAYLFFRNLKQYKEAKNAYILASDTFPGNDYLIPQPYYSVKDQPDRIRTFRNEVRQNVDYSVLFFIIFWGLNVADAAVDAHLKTFDVSENLSIEIKPGYSPMARTNGISLVLNIGK
jgi:hypothetical protein